MLCLYAVFFQYKAIYSEWANQSQFRSQLHDSSASSCQTLLNAKHLLLRQCMSHMTLFLRKHVSSLRRCFYFQNTRNLVALPFEFIPSVRYTSLTWLFMKMNEFLLLLSSERLICFISGVLAAGIIRRLWKLWKAYQGREENRNVRQVIFFPDKEVACKDYFESIEGCSNVQCSFSHQVTGLR